MRNSILLILSICFLVGSCGKEQGDVLSLASEAPATTVRYLMISGQDGNHRGFAIYTTDGTYIRNTDFRAETATPRGMAVYNSTSVLMALDTTDSIYQVDINGNKTLFHGSAQFNGGIYDLAIGNNGNVYAIETNRIEVFDSSGNRLAANYINTTVGGCTLSNPRGMTINAAGNLVVVNQGGSDQVLTYDISNTTATCLSAVNFGNNPYDILLHSDGYMYITSQGDDQVWRTDPDGSNPILVWATDTSLINNPTSIVEHPSGDLLVASSATDTIERITTTGTRVGTTPFIRDTQVLNVGGMAIVESTQ